MSRLTNALGHIALIVLFSTFLVQCVKDENEWLLEQDAIQREKRQQVHQVYIAPADKFLIELKEARDE